GDLAELVCSNSLGSNLVDRASGLLKEELRRLGSLIVACADQTALPAGGALAVDREAFSRAVSERMSSHPWIEIRRQEVQEIPSPRPVIIATGPLTSQALSASIAKLTGEEYLYFYDAMAPIVSFDSIDLSKVFRASRYAKGDHDYINCPLSREEYYHFVEELTRAKTIPLREFERAAKFFEGCLPLEVLAQRGEDALAYGPLRPTGLVDPRTGRRPYAVVQLRQDDLAGTLYNMVGFQTNLRWGEQKRVFRLIPGLEKAEFVRYGQMHRNTFINSPALLEPTMMFRHQPGIFFAGQITGTEGYVAAAAGGLIAGLNAARLIRGEPLLIFPPTTMLGALSHYICRAGEGGFQPMKPNFGLLPPLRMRGKRARYKAYAQRALTESAVFRIVTANHKTTTQKPSNEFNSRLYENLGHHKQ
ncbi:MAG: FADH(2)-oxidizing methylenetetrahydrofolate--tRNA-(uracil(54)-C(5))-methyltransferase TrmFO, partial [Anaerolineae bacterium]